MQRQNGSLTWVGGFCIDFVLDFQPLPKRLQNSSKAA